MYYVVSSLNGVFGLYDVEHMDSLNSEIIKVIRKYFAGHNIDVKSIVQVADELFKRTFEITYWESGEYQVDNMHFFIKPMYLNSNTGKL